MVSDVEKERRVYTVLGLPEGAPLADAKRAYRDLALQHHPDKNPDDPHAEERFKEVSAAYTVLTTKKAEYDAAAAYSVGASTAPFARTATTAAQHAQEELNLFRSRRAAFAKGAAQAKRASSARPSAAAGRRSAGATDAAAAAAAREEEARLQQQREKAKQRERDAQRKIDEEKRQQRDAAAKAADQRAQARMREDARREQELLRKREKLERAMSGISTPIPSSSGGAGSTPATPLGTPLVPPLGPRAMSGGLGQQYGAGPHSARGPPGGRRGSGGASTSAARPRPAMSPGPGARPGAAGRPQSAASPPRTATPSAPHTPPPKTKRASESAPSSPEGSRSGQFSRRTAARAASPLGRTPTTQRPSVFGPTSGDQSGAFEQDEEGVGFSPTAPAPQPQPQLTAEEQRIIRAQKERQRQDEVRFAEQLKHVQRKAAEGRRLEAQRKEQEQREREQEMAEARASMQHAEAAAREEMEKDERKLRTGHVLNPFRQGKVRVNAKDARGALIANEDAARATVEDFEEHYERERLAMYEFEGYSRIAEVEDEEALAFDEIWWALTTRLEFLQGQKAQRDSFIAYALEETGVVAAEEDTARRFLWLNGAESFSRATIRSKHTAAQTSWAGRWFQGLQRVTSEADMASARAAIASEHDRVFTALRVAELENRHRIALAHDELDAFVALQSAKGADMVSRWSTLQNHAVEQRTELTALHGERADLVDLVSKLRQQVEGLTERLTTTEEERSNAAAENAALKGEAKAHAVKMASVMEELDQLKQRQERDSQHRRLQEQYRRQQQHLDARAASEESTAAPLGANGAGPRDLNYAAAAESHTSVFAHAASKSSDTASAPVAAGPAPVTSGVGGGFHFRGIGHGAKDTPSGSASSSAATLSAAVTPTAERQHRQPYDAAPATAGEHTHTSHHGSHNAHPTHSFGVDGGALGGGFGRKLQHEPSPPLGLDSDSDSAVLSPVKPRLSASPGPAAQAVPPQPALVRATAAVTSHHQPPPQWTHHYHAKGTLTPTSSPPPQTHISNGISTTHGLPHGDVTHGFSEGRREARPMPDADHHRGLPSPPPEQHTSGSHNGTNSGHGERGYAAHHVGAHDGARAFAVPSRRAPPPPEDHHHHQSTTTGATGNTAREPQQDDHRQELLARAMARLQSERSV